MTCNYIIHFGNVGMEGVSALGGSSVQEVSRIAFDSWTIVTLHYRSTHRDRANCIHSYPFCMVMVSYWLRPLPSEGTIRMRSRGTQRHPQQTTILSHHRQVWH